MYGLSALFFNVFKFMQAVFNFADHNVHLDTLSVENEDYEEYV